MLLFALFELSYLLLLYMCIFAMKSVVLHYYLYNISNYLNQYRIPYRYEKPIALLDWNKTVICRPDFTVMNKRTGKIFLYEHLGRMDDKDYVSANMRKLDLYEKNNYLLGENLIVTHETSKSPLNVKVLELYIKTYFI